MFAYSRTSRRSDYEDLEIDKLIKLYASLPKDMSINSELRYKFWEYSLAISLCRKEGINNILDIGVSNDIVYGALANYYCIKLRNFNLDDFFKSKINGYKGDLVTCFGMIDRVDNPESLLNKLYKHVAIGGYLLITTDDELTIKNKKRIFTPNDFISISISAEKLGFELYGLNNNPDNSYEPYDYLPDMKNPHISLLLQKTI